MNMYSPPQTEKNLLARRLIWSSFSLYIITLCLPLVSVPNFLDYFFSMVFIVLSPLSLFLYSGSFVLVIFALIFFSHHIAFRIFALFSPLPSLVPLFVLGLNIYMFGGFHVGYFTFALAVACGFVAGIVYKAPKKTPVFQTIVQAQKEQIPPVSGENVMFLETPEQETKTLSFKAQNIDQPPKERGMYLEYPEEEVEKISFKEQQAADVKAERETWFCAECGQEIYVDNRFCEYCGFDLSEQ